MNVLVAENRGVTAKLLRHAGHDVTIARSGLEVGELTARRSFHAIVLGPLGPGTESLMVCDALRRQGNAIPIVLLVSRDGVEARVEGLDAGADDCLPVGCQVDELLARLRALVRRTVAAEPTRRPSQ